MKKSVIGIVIIAIFIVGGIILIARPHSNNAAGNPMNMPHSKQQSSNPTATNAVTISNFAFSPANITVKRGTQVTWTNRDSVAHTVQETDGKTGPNSSNLGQGQTYTFTYNSVGTFKYHCSIHPDMLGTVTVTE